MDYAKIFEGVLIVMVGGLGIISITGWFCFVMWKGWIKSLCNDLERIFESYEAGVDKYVDKAKEKLL